MIELCDIDPSRVIIERSDIESLFYVMRMSVYYDTVGNKQSKFPFLVLIIDHFEKSPISLQKFGDHHW